MFLTTIYFSVTEAKSLVHAIQIKERSSYHSVYDTSYNCNCAKHTIVALNSNTMLRKVTNLIVQLYTELSYEPYELL